MEIRKSYYNMMVRNMKQLSEKTRKKMSLAKMGHLVSEETRRKISLANKGKPSPMKGKKHTEEARLKISLVNIGNKKWLGKHHSEESKLKMSLMHKGYHPKTEFKKGYLMSEYTKAKISLTMKGIPKSTQTKKKISDARLKQILPLKDTSIEIKIQEELKKLNIPFVTHKTLLNLTQCDIFIEPNICIFADGCYWHGCEKCFDQNKFNAMQRKAKVRSLLITQKLINEGFKVLKFWEHDIRNNFEDKVLDEIIFSVQEVKRRIG